MRRQSFIAIMVFSHALRLGPRQLANSRTHLKDPSMALQPLRASRTTYFIENHFRLTSVLAKWLEFLPAAQRHGQGMAKKVQEETFQAFTQWSIIFSIPRFMNGGIWGYHLNQWVNTSPTTPLPGLCTSREILLYMTSLSVQRPGSGVVELVLTHWLTWCPQNPPSTFI